MNDLNRLQILYLHPKGNPQIDHAYLLKGLPSPSQRLNEDYMNFMLSLLMV